MACLLTKLKPKRRWLQFSLRVGFIIVTALCAALSMWVVPAARQRRAVAAIEAMGGRIEYAERWGHASSEPFQVSLLQRWLPPHYFDDVECVDLNASGGTNASLKQLYLRENQVTNAKLAHLKGFAALKKLDLTHTQITDAGAANLREMTELQRLDLSNTQVTKAGVAKLRQELPNCQIRGP